jgi:1-acyl-sn-glycerol-3-phosphate acyltransferase
MTSGPDTFTPPSRADAAFAKAILAPWRALTDPRIDGLEHLPDPPRYLLVGNHTTFGMLDIPFLVLEIHERTGVLVRSLGERQHFRVPLWRDLLTRYGAVDGSREATRALMRAGEPVLVFPGGGREVARRRGDHYPLVWRERIGFARLAIEHGYAVVPFAMIGVDDMWDVVVDSGDPLYAPARALARRAGVDPELLFPLVRGLGPTPLPRPQRIYGRIGAPIDARAFGSSWDDAAGAAALRDEVKAEVRAGIDALEAERERDPGRRLAPRLRGEAVRLTTTQSTALRRVLTGLTQREASPGGGGPSRAS